jgi:tripartite ATP-independent transporter DctM subunit
MELAIFLVLFAALFLLGMPVGFAMIISGISYALTSGLDMAFYSLEMFKSVNGFILIAIPMFILTAEIMNVTTVADRMFDFSNSLVGWIPGGMGHTNVLTSVIFAGMSGSAAADIGGIGYLSYKAMVDRGFSKPFSAAVTSVSSCIGPIIPPSIPVVVYAMVVPGASIIRLFLGGIIPGIMMALFLMLYIYAVSKKRGYAVEPKPSFSVLVKSLRRGILPVLTPVILLVSITSGMVTISEGAIVTVIYSLFLGVIVYRQMGLKRLIRCFESAFVSTGSIMIFFAAGKIFSFVLSRANIPFLLSNALLGVTESKVIILILINVLFIIVGFFSEALVNIVLFAPIVLPMANAVGIDPNVMGVLIIITTVVGAVTPPIGTLVFNVAGLTKVPLESIFREAMPMLLGYLAVLALLIAFPVLISFIPNLLLG